MVAARSPLGAIQQAIYERLDGDSGTPAVYDQVPEGAVYPYVVVGEATEVPRNWHRGIGRESTHTLHVWTDRGGFAAANAITDRVVELLDHQPMELPEPWVVIACRFEFSQTLRDPNPPHPRHVPIRFRIVTGQED